GYADQVYGYANHNQPGALWLQYWFFYYYNDKALLGSGNHEGDWELVQVGIGVGERPVAVTYSQHTSGERCDWAGVEKEDRAPGGRGGRGRGPPRARRPPRLLPPPGAPPAGADRPPPQRRQGAGGAPAPKCDPRPRPGGGGRAGSRGEPPPLADPLLPRCRQP